MRCARRRASSFWKGFMRIGVSAARRSASSGRRNAGSSRRTRKRIHSGGSGGSLIKRHPMKWVKFSKYDGDDFGIDAQDLMEALANFFLESGFNNPYMRFSEMNGSNLEDLKQAIQRALESGELFSDEQVRE